MFTCSKNQQNYLKIPKKNQNKSYTFEVFTLHDTNYVLGMRCLRVPKK